MNFLTRFRNRLIPEIRHAWKYWSVQLSMVGVALSGAWAAMPADTRALIPGAQWIGLVLFAATALSRVIQQGPKNG